MNTATKSAAETAIEEAAAQLGLSITSKFVPCTETNPRKMTLNWKVTLLRDGKEILTTDYSAGCGHCPSYKQGDNSVVHWAVIGYECTHGEQGVWRDNQSSQQIFPKIPRKPIMPTLANVLYCLVNESDALQSGGFEDWASNFGYDTDSRKAESIYRACLENALKMQAAIGHDGMDRLRTACADY